jgi:CNT family concentrative nucleoside transporter
VNFGLIQSLIGFIFFMLIAFIFSEHRRKINWRLIISAFILQNILFLLIRYVPVANNLLNALSSTLVNLLDYAHDGAKFIFGDLADSKKFGFIFFVVVIPTLIFFGSLVSILYFFGIIQKVIKFLAFLLHKTIKLSGVESLVVIADIFLGQSEGPMIIGPYIKNMTRSELGCAFTAGLANLSGSTLGMYLYFLSGGDHIESLKFANYLVTATFMNAMSAIVFAKILFPETHLDKASDTKIEIDSHKHSNILDAVVDGAMVGLKIGAAMVAVLMAVISLVHLINGLLSNFGNLININNMINTSTNGVFNSLSLEYILGQIFRVFAFFMGINWAETLSVGSLLGQKVAINEFVAYVSLGHMKLSHIISERSVFISTFALASFSNFSSIGISMGVFSVLAPSRKKDLASIAWKALFGAVLAGFLTASVAGLWYGILG